MIPITEELIEAAYEELCTQLADAKNLDRSAARRALDHFSARQIIDEYIIMFGEPALLELRSSLLV